MSQLFSKSYSILYENFKDFLKSEFNDFQNGSFRKSLKAFTEKNWLKKTVGSLQPSRKDIYDKNFKLSPTFAHSKKIKIFGASLHHSLQLVYTRNEKYSSLEPPELANKLSVLQ